MEAIDFAEAIARGAKKKHILLGNGFSRAYRDDIFSYDSLLEKASLSPNLSATFKAINTSDFEEVVRGLEFAANAVSIYESAENALCQTFKKEADQLKKKLIQTIAAHHPKRPTDITDYSMVAAFLHNFEKIYTLNYDLLLYWSILSQAEIDGAKSRDDGFRNPIGESSDQSDYVTWEIENTNEQNVYYLHGALHLFQSESELRKFTWSRTGQKLLDQITKSLENGEFPLFVSEGTTQQKLKKIVRSSYLHRGLKSLAAIGGELFTYGFSFSDNDAHILDKISKSKIEALWVGIYGDINSHSNQYILEAAKATCARSSRRRRIDVRAFQTKAMKLWP